MIAQRAIDNWHEFGGKQPPESGAKTTRHHDMTDAFAIFTPISLPNVLTSYTTDGIELRNLAKSSRVTVKDSTIEIVCANSQIIVNSDGTVSITAASGITLNGNLQVNGTISSTGNVSDATGTIQGVRDIYNSHVHVENDSGGPTDPPTQQM